MRITVIPKAETTDQFNIRIPVSLKARYERLRHRENEIQADVNKMLVHIIEEFVTAIEQKLDGPSTKRAKRGPNKTLGQTGPPNGIDLERA